MEEIKRSVQKRAESSVIDSPDYDLTESPSQLVGGGGPLCRRAESGHRGRVGRVGPIAVAALVVARWPSAGVGDLSGAAALQVLRVFGYGLLAEEGPTGAFLPSTVSARQPRKDISDPPF